VKLLSDCIRIVLTATLAAFLLLSAKDGQAEEETDVGLAQLMAAIGQERILGMDYVSDIIPSTSDCIGDPATPLCAVDTFMACTKWDGRPGVCESIGHGVGSYEIDRWRYSRFRYRVTFAETLDAIAHLPWIPPLDPAIEPAKNYVCGRPGNRPPQPGDVALILETKECELGGLDAVVGLDQRGTDDAPRGAFRVVGVPPAAMPVRTRTGSPSAGASRGASS